MSPTLVPVVNARSAVLCHVKRAEGHTDTSVVVLAVICVVILTVTLLSIARYFCRERRRNSSSSTDPSSRSPSHWYSPRCFGSLRTGRTATSSHQDPLPALPPRDPVRPWPATYRQRYPRVHFADRPYSHRSHRFGEYRPGSLTVYRLSGLNAYQPGDHPPRRPPGFNAYTPGGLPLYRRPRPYNMKRSRLRTSSPIPEADPVPESSETNDVDVQLSDIPQSHDAQSVRSTPAVARKTSIGTSEEARISHEAVNECDAANDSAPECASGTDTLRAGTDEERLGECEVST
ncbi:hypothetical protein M404DRAFT_1006373 [Pisolithus tinctorius Marx 270]|uniref:Uncharacterized protein n=1 Tax=Pisolithus tinctorius Marx 270 TaxID=870435 RepID=A0A0C3N7E8_PISTI|nr:hypothetical protein M404DRAFT_1006373 [Pisolithus tinctorius Marx 270]